MDKNDIDQTHLFIHKTLRFGRRVLWLSSVEMAGLNPRPEGVRNLVYVT